MNNLFINISALAFTNIEETLSHVPSQGEIRRKERFHQEIENQKLVWKKSIFDSVAQQSLKYVQIVKRDIGADMNADMSTSKSNSKENESAQ